jgi:tRNA (cytidine/uridine-2'-O-)-methyltransferase
MEHPLHLPPHALRVALLQPQIAPNTGNIARLCVATGTELHLVRPLGFILSDKELRRSAMDYWPRLELTLHDDTDAFLRSAAGQRVWYFSSKAKRPHWSAEFRDGDWLVFGSETRGIDESILAANPERSLRIPQATGERCLNLSTAAGVALYEALRQLQLAAAPSDKADAPCCAPASPADNR